MSNQVPVYVEVAATVTPLEPFRDIFIAQLGAIGFESFSETELGFAAYIQKDQFSQEQVNDALSWEGVECSFTLRDIEQVNWNEEWEKNFDPIEVDGRVYIRAPFHQERVVLNIRC